MRSEQQCSGFNMPTTGVGLDTRGHGASCGMYSQRYVSVFTNIHGFCGTGFGPFSVGFFKESSADY